MKQTAVSLALAAALVLAACGSGGSSESGSQGTAPAAAKPAPSGDAPAEVVAREARGKIKCPAKVKSERADGAPVDDVLGVRVGMTYEEAKNVALCTHDLLIVAGEPTSGFNIKTYGQTIRQGMTIRFAEPRVQKSSREIMKEMQDDMLARSGNAVRQDMKPGQSKWYVTTMGMPGAEKVIAVAREEWFEEGHSPTMASLEQALVAKYGKFTRSSRNPTLAVLTWAYDPLGRPITETSPLYYSCGGIADPDSGTNFKPDCGLVVMAQLFGSRENPELAQYFQVGAIDQAVGYEAITGTERALQAMDAERRAQEVKDAAKNADVPKL